MRLRHTALVHGDESMNRILPARTRSLSGIALMSSAALVLCLAATSRGTESAQAKVNHYIKYDALALGHHGVKLTGIAGDPMVADYLLRSGERSRIAV